MCSALMFILVFDYLLKTTDEGEKNYVSLRNLEEYVNEDFPCSSFLIFLKSTVDKFPDEILVEVIKHMKIENSINLA